MEQKFISVEGIQIACYKKNGAKENTIFFIHGNSSSPSYMAIAIQQFIAF